MLIDGFPEPVKNQPSTENKGKAKKVFAKEGADTGLGRDLLMAYITANSTDALGNSALVNTVQTNNVGMARMLIENGANPNAQNQAGSSALHHAALHGYLEMVRLLLRSGAEPNIANQHSETPLICAAYNGHHQIIPLLVQYSADLEVCDLRGRNALTWAIMRNQICVIEEILCCSARIGCYIVDEMMLNLAASLKQGEICRLLLDANLNRINLKKRNQIF